MGFDCSQSRLIPLAMEDEGERFLDYVFCFLLWTLASYALHRLAHVKSPYNPLFKIHLAHHKAEYGKEKNYDFKWPGWRSFVLWFGDLQSTLDVWITLIIPAIVVSILFTQTHFTVLIGVYLYEVFLSEHNLDHNPEITGPITRVLAIGQYHLTHHHYPKYNYGLYLTLWDIVFITTRPKDLRRTNDFFWQAITRNEMIGY